MITLLRHTGTLPKCTCGRRIFRGGSLLGKAVSVDPNNGQNLMLLADAQYMDHRYDAAIASARGPSFVQYTTRIVHYIAGRAYDKRTGGSRRWPNFRYF